MGSEMILNKVLPCRFKVGIAVCHAERFVSDHFLGVLECAARHDDVQTVSVPVVVEMKILNS
jgi:hypothetical protein